MSKPCPCDFSKDSPMETVDERQDGKIPVAARPPVDEMSRVLRTTPVHIASDLSGGAIAQWSHDAFHEVQADDRSRHHDLRRHRATARAA